MMSDDLKRTSRTRPPATGSRSSPGRTTGCPSRGTSASSASRKARRDPALVEPVKAALSVLAAIYARLGGDVSVLRASRENLLLPVDLVHAPTGTVIEVDDATHFTSYRLAALELYPEDLDVEQQKALCREWAPRTDGLSRGLAAKGFGFGGLGRERAYRDALFDLATPAMGHPPVIRVAAVDGDGAAAYARHRETIIESVSASP